MCDTRLFCVSAYFSTVFIPCQHCPVALTTKRHNFPHQTKIRSEDHQTKIWFRTPTLKNLFCVFTDLHFYSPEPVHNSAVNVINRPCTSVQFKFAFSVCSRCSVFSSFFSHEAWPGMLVRLSLCFLLLQLLTCLHRPSLAWARGNHTLYIKHLTPWTTNALWLENQRKKML